MNRFDHSPAVLAILVVTAVALSQYPARANFAQDTAPGAGVSKDTKEIRMTAKKYEYDPAVITVKEGEHVTLIITALDHDHGFKIDGLRIDQLLKKGEPTTIEFTADTTGTFPFQCSHFCGLGHKGMKGELIVERVSQELPKERPDASAQFSNR
jgi:heme/copper-type cytochrome/quinol oxidase subunit 2